MSFNDELVEKAIERLKWSSKKDRAIREVPRSGSFVLTGRGRAQNGPTGRALHHGGRQGHGMRPSAFIAARTAGRAPTCPR
jgi:hypothetical protein